MATITTRIEKARGCGYRIPGGMYLVSDGEAAICHKLPIALTTCPCCGMGIKPARGFTWINSNIFANSPCAMADECMGSSCAANKQNEAMGLIWVGEKFYSTPEQFMKESGTQGISRRIAMLPNDFKVGKTWIVLAHRKTIPAIGKGGLPDRTPGIFSMFCPSRIEYIVKGDESEAELDRLEKRGFTLVKVIKDSDAQQELITE